MTCGWKPFIPVYKTTPYIYVIELFTPACYLYEGAVASLNKRQLLDRLGANVLME